MIDTLSIVSKTMCAIFSAIDCGLSRDILNTSRTVGQTTLNQSVGYSCASGYQFNTTGSRSLSANCSAQGIWTIDDDMKLDDVDITCERKCKFLLGIDQVVCALPIGVLTNTQKLKQKLQLQKVTPY